MPRKLKSQDVNPYEIIRGMWEGAYVSHFVRIFRNKFGFSFLSTQDIEDSLISDESVAVADICARLLRYLTGNNDIRIANFDSFLQSLLIKEKVDVPRFLNNETTWWQLTPEEKLGIIKWLIDHVHQEKEEDFADYLNDNYNPDDLRGICVGHDAFNNIYWYLDDLRLYREISKKQNKKEWECVCVTLSDWYIFLKQFRKTTNLQEKELYSYLNLELLPFIKLELLKTRTQDKEADNIFLLKRESEELKDMLEKKKNAGCNNRLVKTLDHNGTDTDNHEKHNGSITNPKCSTVDEIVLNDFKVKSEENSTVCDGHLNVTKTDITVNDSRNTLVMDVTADGNSSCVINSSCENSCTTTCVSTQLPNISGGENNVCNNSSHCNSTNSNVLPPLSRNTQDVPVNIQQPPSDNASDSCSVTSNKENAPPTSGSSGADIPPMSAISHMIGSTSTPATTASVQPLPSNMVNKTSFPLETQYMQQQSQIFVFSTELANKAAESCLSGHFPSIIAFHCAQPGTKSFLEKYPLKVQQFNRQNPAVWLNTLASMKQGGRSVKGSVGQFAGNHGNRFTGPTLGISPPVPCSGSCNIHGGTSCAVTRGPAPWQSAIGNNAINSGIITDMNSPCHSQTWSSQQQQFGVNTRFQNTMPQGMPIHQIGPNNNDMVPCGSNAMPNMSPSGSISGVSFVQGPNNQSTLTGVKIPDENLTPEQRQHRVEQLATIRKMQQLLFPEQRQLEQVQGSMVGPTSDIPSVGGILPHGSQQRFGAVGEMCVHPNIDPCFSPHQVCMTEHDHAHQSSEVFVGSNMSPNFNASTYPPISVAAQMKWHELQHQFYEERRKNITPSSASLNSASNNTQASQQSILQQQQPPYVQNQQTPSQVVQHPPQSHTPLQQQQSVNSPSPNMGLSPGTRIQGPPPPYHQSAKRSMSSPHPISPNPSSLSLPSPRMVSGLSSPSDPSRQFPHPTQPGPRLPHPSPGTSTSAGSSSLHTTPLNSPKPLNSSSGPGSNSGSLIKTPTTPSNTASTPTDTPSSSSVTLTSSGPNTPATQCVSYRKQSSSCNDTQDSISLQPPSNASADFTSNSGPASTSNNMSNELFCSNSQQSSQSGAKLDHCGPQLPVCHKEPTSLMPVPSPQQIEYLNEFDGQELTIQKQPNRSMQSSVALTTTSQSQFQSPDTSFPNTPGSCPTLENSQDSLSNRYPVSAPASIEGIQRFSALSPQLSGFETTRHMLSSQSGDSSTQRFPSLSNADMVRLAAHSSFEEGSRFPVQSPQGPTFGISPGNTMDGLRFPSSTSETMQKYHGPSPHTTASLEIMQSRFVNSSPHAQNIGASAQFGICSDSVPSQSFSSPTQTIVSNSGPCLSGAFASNATTHSHLHNLQKMTPPFDGVVGNKVPSKVSSPSSQCQNNSTSLCASSPLAASSQSATSHRLTHFDPIASMAAMSEPTAPLATSVVSIPAAQSINATNISGAVASDSGGNGNVANFNLNMSSHGLLQNNAISNQLCHYNMSPQVGHMACNQPMNNSYMNSAMPVQQLNVHNNPTSTFNAGIQIGNLNPHVPMHNNSPSCQDGNANTVSCSVTTNHPIMHSGISAKTSNVNICTSGPRPSHSPFAGQPTIQRNANPVATAISPTMINRVTGPSSANFTNTNIQVKANAPNTIQYLPARPQNSNTTNRPPTLEFLQRFAAPLTNLDNKVPTHNLQYFPNNRIANTPPGHAGVQMGSAPSGVGPGIITNQRPVSIMMGSMMRGTSPMPHCGNQMFPLGAGMSVSESSMFGRPHCPPGPQINPQMVPIGGSQTVSFFPNKQMPLPMGGMAPDATQPLPPSMGQSFSYKQSPFYGPTTADPNYAVQFHNFQQQLYATNTRGSQINSQTNLSGQGFFGPK